MLGYCDDGMGAKIQNDAWRGVSSRALNLIFTFKFLILDKKFLINQSSRNKIFYIGIVPILYKQ